MIFNTTDWQKKNKEGLISHLKGLYLKIIKFQQALGSPKKLENITKL